MALLLFLIGAIALLALQRAIRAERLLSEQRAEIDQLRLQIKALTQIGREPAAPPPAPAPAPAPPAAAQPAAAAEPEPSPDRAVLEAAQLSAAEAAFAEGAAAPGEAVHVSAAAAVAAYTAASGESLVIPAAASEPAAAPQPAAAAAPRHDVLSPDSIESRIGGRWLLYIGIAALVLGTSYFVKYAFDNEWVGPQMRVVLGVVAGVGLTALGQRFVSAGYTLYGQALSGGGIGILYLSIFAAHRWYELISRPPAFAGMIITTAVGAWLADRQRSQLLAVMAVTVGFATPFLIGGDSDAQITLFTYDAILVAGTLYLARRRSWPALDLISYILTVLTIATWADVYYRPGAFLVTELFLTLFLVMFLFVLREHWAAASINPLAALVQVTLSLAPVLYHIASLTILFPHTGALFVYLIVFTMAGLILARQLSIPWLRIVIFVAVAMPFYTFVEHRVPSGWLIASWIAMFALYGLHTLAQVHRLDEEREPERERMPGMEIFLLHANGLWLLFCVEALISRRGGDWASSAAFLLAAWYGVLASLAWRWHREAALHALAWASALIAIGFALEFSGPWLIVAIATEGAVLVWLALRSQRPWIRAWGGVLLGIATIRALAMLTEPASLDSTTLFNPRALSCLFIAAMMYALAWLHARLEATPGATAISRASLLIAANMLTLLVFSAEIDAFFDRRAFADGTGLGEAGATSAADVARQLTLSITWAFYALVLVAVGIWRDYRPVRLFAIVVFALTIAKVFLVDIATLDRVYKMLSVMALGVLLLIASYLYQRLNLRTQEGRML